MVETLVTVTLTLTKYQLLCIMYFLVEQQNKLSVKLSVNKKHYC